MSKKQKPVFFIDRALGKRAVAEALRKAGAIVEIHDDHFPPEALCDRISHNPASLTN